MTILIKNKKQTMNKVSVELDLNAQAYVQGIDKATDSTEKYTSETRKVADAQVNLRKELVAAKKEVQNLAAGYARLDAAAKQSAFGKEMARQLEEAKQKAAEFIDLQGDLNTELKNMASDTHTLDMLSEGMGVLGDATAATMGIVAQFTGNEEDARRAVLAFTTAQSVLGTVTKLQNALQKQSNIMLGVAKVQNLAAAKATELNAAATGKATIAQKALNTVAKSNPYILLATAIATVTAAIGAYILMTNKAESAQEKLKKTMHEASIEGQKDAVNETTKLDLLYKSTQDVNLSMKDRLKAVDDLQKQYPGYFGNISKEKILVGEASDAYKQLRDDIIAAALARAYEKKIEDKASQLVDLREQRKEEEKLNKIYKKDAENAKAAVNYWAQGTAGINGSAENARKFNSRLQDSNNTLKEIDKQIEQTKSDLDSLYDERSTLMPQVNRLESGKETPKNTPSGSNKPEKTNKKEAEKQLTYLEKLKKEEDEIIAQLQDINLASPDASSLITGLNMMLKKVQDVAKQYKIAVGLEVDKDAIDENSLKAAADAIRKETENLLTGNNSKPTYNFSALAGGTEKQQKQSEEAENKLEQFNRLDEAIKKYTKDYANASAEEKAAIDEVLPLLDEKYEKLNDELNMYQQMNEAQIKTNNNIQKTQKQMQKVADVAGAAGSAFRALGEAAGDSGINVLGIVAEAIANVALGYAKATSQASEMGPWVWIAFALSGLATMATMISQIKSATSGGYAQGGIIPGSSYSGDNLTARVNSGEMILNQRQQKNLFNMIDEGRFPQNGGTNVTVTGVIRGTDLLLVQKNANKVRSRAGASISF